MENRIKQYARTLKGSKRDNESAISLIRYADDFVILHENPEVIKQCQEIIIEWLSQYDLELKPEKTSIVHTLHELNGKKPGFNFLGFNIRQYHVSKYDSGRNTKGELLGFKTLIKPSRESIKRHYDKIAKTCKENNAAPQAALIAKLNPIIKGWCNYFKTVASKETFSGLKDLTHKRLKRWANRRHPNKGKTWVTNKYWKTIGKDNWVFSPDGEFYLYKHDKTVIERHVKVIGTNSPYDGDTLYWAKRKGTHPELKNSIAKLLKKQDGKCNWCNLTFHSEDKIETDHIIPKALGGNVKDNLQLLHKHCHDIKTKEDLKAIKKHKVKKEWKETIKQFNSLNWTWVDDIPTLV